MDYQAIDVVFRAYKVRDEREGLDLIYHILNSQDVILDDEITLGLKEIDADY